MPDDDFELLPLSKLAKEKLVKEKAVKVKGAARQRLPGGGGIRRIKEIEDPAVAKKLSRFSSAPAAEIEEDKPNHLSSSATARKSEKETTVLPTKPSRFSSSRKSSRRPHIRMKIKETDASSDSQEKTSEEERNSTPRLREKTLSGSFRRTSSPSGRMKKPVAGLSVSSGEEVGEPHRPVSRSRSRGRVREQQAQSTEASQISSDPETVSSEDRSGETEEKEEGGVSRGRVRKPPSLASVVRHR